jgi:hypothetical protein
MSYDSLFTLMPCNYIFTFTYPSTAAQGSFFTCFLNGLDDMQEPQVTAYEKNGSTSNRGSPLCGFNIP